MDRNDLIELADYNAWATSRLAAAVLELTPEEFAREIPSSFPSVRETTAHLVAAEELWVERWHEKPPRPITMPDELPADAPALVARWKAADASALAFLRGPYDLERPLPIRT
ncbi:MAG TPA: DinB family protein, partial [Planctomycetota bacterium]|nr:DinB family protein [Planctomycetota bacterium]